MSSSGRATVTRAGYRAYISSPEWQVVRRRYWASKLPKDCYCCGRFDGPKDLHHRTYKNLGNERLMDLVPVCRDCHFACHDRLKLAPRKGLWWATKSIRKERHR